MPRRLVSLITGLALGAGALSAVAAPAGAAAVTDTAAPTLTSFAVLPATVATRYADADTVVDLRVKDLDSSGLPGAGFDHGTVALTSGSTTLGPVDVDTSDLVAGSVTDGTYDVHVDVPQGTPAGRYTAAVTLVDAKGNTASVTNTTSPLTVTSPLDLAAPTQSGGVSANPSAVDVTRGDRDVAYAVHLLDPTSGVADAQLTLRDPAGHTEGMDLFQTSGTPQDGRWTGHRTFGATDATGAWTVVSLTADDVAGNTLSVASGLGGTETVTRTADTAAPVFVSATPTPASVTTTSAGATVNVALRATDNLSGVTYGEVTYSAPGGVDSVTGYFSGSPDSGSAVDGVWTAQVTLPARAANGSWTLTSAYLTDAQGNDVYYDTSNPPPASHLLVTTAPDTTAPTASGIWIGPSVVPSPDGSATIVTRFTVADTGSGFGGATAAFKAPDGTVTAADTTTVSDPGQYSVTGSTLNGVVTFPALLPVAAKGTWTLASLTVTDLAGNSRVYTGATLTGTLTVTVAAQAADTTPPALTSLSITSAAAAGGALAVTATVGVSDGGSAAAGFFSGSLQLTPPDGGPSLYFQFDGTRPVTGDYESGTFADTETLPRSSTPGTWTVTGVSLWDNSWNDREYTRDTVAAALGGPAPTLTVTPVSDHTAPTLTSITTDAATADVTAGDPLVVHVAGTDDASGVASAAVTLTGPAGRSVTGTGTVGTPALTAGVDVSVAVPQYASTGTWTMTKVVLTDRTGNAHTYAAADLTALPGIHAVSVTALADAAAPTADTLALSPKAVTTTSGAVAVDVTVHLADNPAGVDTAGVTLTSPHGAQNVTAALQLLTGTIYDGWWQGSVSVPQYAESGTWTVSALSATDLGGNQLTLGAAALGAAGTLAVTGASDTTAPTLTALSITPNSVDTASGAQTVAVTATATDAQSGVATMRLAITAPDGTAGAVDLTRSDTGSGTTATLAGTVPVAATAPTGTWTVTTASVSDRSGNARSYTGAQLTGSGLPAGFGTFNSAATTTPPATTPPATTPPATTPPATTPPATTPPASTPPATTPPATTPPTTDPVSTTPPATTPPATTPPATTPPATTAPSVHTALATGTVVTSATYGTAVQVSGKLVRSDSGAVLAGHTVQLQWRSAGSTGAFHTVSTTARTGATGWATFTTFKPGYSVQLRLYAPASTGFLGAASGTHTVSVRRYVSAYAVTSARRGQRFTVHGSVLPATYGRRLYFQRWTGRYWHTLASPILHHVAYSFTTSSSTRGTFTYRVVSPAYGGLLTTSSTYRKVRIS